jgi:hypothetical protein
VGIELEVQAVLSLERLLQMAEAVRDHGPVAVWEWWLVRPNLLSDAQARRIVTDTIVDAVTYEPTFLARVGRARRRLERQAEQIGRQFEAMEGRPPRVEPAPDGVEDVESRMTLWIMASLRANELAREPSAEDE